MNQTVVAFHEAGHTAAAYATGGRLGRGGVRIHSRDYGQTTMRRGSPSKELIRTLAGWVVEAKFEGRRSLVAYGEIRKLLRELRAVRPHYSRRLFRRHFNNGNDSFDVAATILLMHPHIGDREAIRLVRRYEAKTVALFNRPQVWASVERVVQALLRRRQLSHSAVCRLLGVNI